MLGGRLARGFSLYSVVKGRGGDVASPLKTFGSAGLGPRGGGVDRIRTDDLRLAKPALSRLSYDPIRWARADLNCRPHAYQACALTT